MRKVYPTGNGLVIEKLFLTIKDLEAVNGSFALARMRRNPFHFSMPGAALSEIIEYCDHTLETSEFEDYKGAANGLQVENRGSVHRIAAAVDGSLATVRLAIDARADLLLVHHGLFWGPSHPWTGKCYELLRLLLDNNLAIYSSHLPLDAHVPFGNNAQLCSAMRLQRKRPFFISQGRPIGFVCEARLRRGELVRRLQDATGAEPLLIPAGPETCRRIGIVTGGAGGDLKQVVTEEAIDTFITGEGPHWTYALAEELGVNVLYGGHYATETFGVKALAAHLSKRFKVPWVFLDHPTGL